jgi:hypothetical protein
LILALLSVNVGFLFCIALQVKCFSAPLQPTEISGVKRVVQEKMPEGVNDNGLTLTGFLFLHALFIEKGRLETTWTVLRKFGYDNDLKLRDDLIAAPIKRAPDQVMFCFVFLSQFQVPTVSVVPRII